MVEEIVDEAAAVLEVVADNLWVTWGMRVIPNMVAQVRVEGGVGSESASKDWNCCSLCWQKRTWMKTSLIRRHVIRRS